MNCNVGTVDRVIRAILGLGILALGFYLRSVWGLVGLFPIWTAYTGYCPLYGVRRLSTFHEKKESDDSEHGHHPGSTTLKV